MSAQYLRLFRWHVLRYLARHPLLATLNVATVALGVALYLAIQIANYSANRAFEASVDVVAGKAQLEVNATAGDLPDELFPKIARQPGVAAATPIVRGFLTLPAFPGEYLDLLGIDILTNEPFRTFDLTDFQTRQFGLQQWLRGPRTVAVSEELARQHHLRAGDEIDAQINGETKHLTIGFLLRTRGTSANANPHFAAMDIGWAQELLGRRATLDSISLRLTNGSDPAKIATELRKGLPPDTTVAAPAQRGEQVEKMLAGFQLNLQAMSLVSLLVGMFLIYNTIEASVVRRRSEIGILRSLGVTRREIRWLFLGEAVVLGAVGIAAGMAGGYLLARELVGTVAETISSLYVLLSVQQVVVSPWIWSSALLLGFASVLGAAWLPARRCGRDGSRRNAPSRRPDRKGRAAFARLDVRQCLVAFSGNRALGTRVANRTGVAWFRCGLFRSRRFFRHRAGDHLSLLTRGAGDDSSKDRTAPGRAKSWPNSVAQFGHDRIAGRRRGDDRGCRGDGIFISPDGRRLDQSDADRRSFHWAGGE